MTTVLTIITAWFALSFPMALVVARLLALSSPRSLGIQRFERAIALR